MGGWGDGDEEMGRCGDEGTGPPRWRATASRTIIRSSCSFISHHQRHPHHLRHVYRVNNADDGRIDRRAFAAQRVTGGLAFNHQQHRFPDTSAD